MPGFLMKRSKPRARSGWFEDGDRPDENPIKPPWVHLGDGGATILSGGSIVVDDNFATTDVGGPSYAYQPLTPNWGFEAEIWWPNGISLGQSFACYFTDSWVVVGATFQYGMGVRFANNAGRSVYISHFVDIWTLAAPVATFDMSYFDYANTPITMKLWVDNDSYCRLWVNGRYAGAWIVQPGFEFHDNRRSVRFNNASVVQAEIRWLYHYDRPSDFPYPPGIAWSSFFYDDFNRGDAPVGNGWTAYGSTNEAQIRAQSYAWANTNDGTRAVMRSTGTTNGRQRVEAVIGGNANLSASPSVLLVGCNAAGTSGLVCFVQSGTITLNLLTGSIAVTSPANVQYGSVTPSFTNGHKISLCLYDKWAWVEVNGVVVIQTYIDTAIPNAQNYCGGAVRRNAFTNSNSWNDLRVLTA